MKKKYYHNKLVRDKIPEIIREKGDGCETKILNLSEYRREIRKKLVEEAKEVDNASKSELLNELSDVLQLVMSISDFEGISIRKLENQRQKKEKKAGAYKKRMFLIWSNKPGGQK